MLRRSFPLPSFVPPERISHGESPCATTRKLLVLALDAASPSLLRSWAADGTLPNIAKLMATWTSWGNTRSVDGLYVGSTWPSFFTALNPAGHGFYWLDRLARGAYRRQPCTAADIGRRKALWEVL